MAIPGYSQTIKDGGRGLIAYDANKLPLVILGVAASGDVNSLVNVLDPDDAAAKFTSGPLAEAAAYARLAGVSVLACRIACAADGTAGSVTKTPSGGGATLTVSGTPHDSFDVSIKVVSSGAVGTGTIAISLDGGLTYSPTVTAVSPYDVPASLVRAGGDPGITLTWSGTLAAGDIYTFSTVAPVFTTGELADALAAVNASDEKFGLVAIEGVDPTLALTAVTSAGTTPPAVTVTGTPASSAYKFRVEITTGGAVGTAIFKWSSDGGTTYTTTVTTASTAVLGSTGVTVHFPAGTYATNNIYTFGAQLSGTAARLATASSAALTADAAKKKYRVVCSAPVADDEAIKNTVASLDMKRVALAADRVKVRSALTDRLEWRPLGVVAAVRKAQGDLSEDPASGVSTTPLFRVEAIGRDERKTEGLDAARVTTARTWEGLKGQYYLTNLISLAIAGSDYQLMHYGLIIDAGCTATYMAGLFYSSAKIKLAKGSKKIDEAAAQKIEKRLNRALKRTLLDKGHAVSASVVVNRTDDLGDTDNLRWKTSIVPYGYAKQIEEEVSLALP